MDRQQGFQPRPRPAGPPPFRPPPPRPSFDPPTVHSVRLQDGDRQIEVSGSPVFVRQVLDDLPSLWARLRGEAPPRPASIRMPDPPAPLAALAGDAGAPDTD